MRGGFARCFPSFFPQTFLCFSRNFSEKVKLVRSEERGVRAGGDSHGAFPHFSANLFCVFSGFSNFAFFRSYIKKK